MRALLLSLLALALACAPARADVVVLVSSNGWHSGIVIDRAGLPPGAIPEAADIQPAIGWLEFGWGDAEYYPDPEASVFTALRAATGGPAVVHLSGRPEPYGQVFPSTETVPLTLSDAQFARLTAALGASFARGEAARAPVAAPGLYSFSRFYPATGRFSLANTCNTWTAGMLNAAGLPVDANGVQRAEDLLVQVRPLAASRPD
jgi:uncharacterized protein (TIGR02117 family)